MSHLHTRIHFDADAVSTAFYILKSASFLTHNLCQNESEYASLPGHPHFPRKMPLPPPHEWLSMYDGDLATKKWPDGPTFVLS